MSINNKTLLFQLKEHFGNSIPIDLLPLLSSVNEVYNKTTDLSYSDDALVKVKSKTRTSSEQERLKLHFSMVQQMAKTGSWEFDFPVNYTAGQAPANDSHVYYFSDEVYRIMGMEPGSDEISKDFFFPQLSPYDLSIILENATGDGPDIKQYEEEHVVKMKDGTERIVLKKSDIFFNRNSASPTRILGTLQDVTEVRTLENDLRKVKREKENVLQNLFNAYLCYDVINDKVLFANAAFNKIFDNILLQNGNTRESFLSILDDENSAGSYSLVRKLVRGITVNHNFRIRLNNGNYLWLESRLVPTLGRNGRLTQIEVIANDVTSWKQTEKSAAEVRSGLQQQLFAVGEVVILLDNDLNITYASDNVSRLLGFTPADLTGTPICGLVCAEDVAGVTPFYKNLRPGSDTERLAFRLMHKNGSEVWCECLAGNMTDNTLVGGIMARFRDATFFKEHETRLASTVDDLKKANAHLEDFVSVVSHDLRAPLASMRGILDLIDMKEEHAAIADELAYLRSSVKNLDEFIVDMLDYSRCTRTAIKTGDVDFEAILTNVTNFLKFMNPQGKAVRFMKEVHVDGAFCSDAKLISVVLSNLVSNAIRYSNPDADVPVVAVRINATSEWAVIEVADNGIGISADHLPRIFDMFFRVSADNSGTGIGLHLVKLAAEKISGEISVNSEKGVGTNFTIRIPNLLNNKTNQ